MIYHDVLEAVGNTPLIRLNRMTDPEDAEVLVKFEAVNIGGSVKTRTALNMIQAAEKDGRIGPDTIIVEPTSGNQGIGLALIGSGLIVSVLGVLALVGSIKLCAVVFPAIWKGIVWICRKPFERKAVNRS